MQRCYTNNRGEINHRSSSGLCVDEIVGILIYFKGDSYLLPDDEIKKYISCPDIEHCNKNYFKVLFDEYKEKPNIVCISNVAVKETLRGMGIGQRILGDFIKTRDEILELDVLCDNPAAIHIYEKCGFKILYDEEAFAFDPIPNFKSYRMSNSI